MEEIVVKRTLPALVLDRSPLVYFLAQVRFSAILAMGEHLNRIQERLRKIGYPRFSTAETFNISAAPNSSPIIEKVALWIFTAADRKTGIVLSNNFVTYQTVDYGRYEETLPKIVEALQAVHEAAGIGFFERIGLRYLDAVIPNRAAGENFATYLRPELIGISGKAIGVETLHHNTAFVGRTELNGTLVVRFTTTNGPNILPPDLAGAPLELRSFEIPPTERIGILDFDHYLEISDAFSINFAQQALGDLHDAIARAFNECTTEKARDLWGKHDVV